MLNFVLCPSYHGATLLSLLLNLHPEISSLGDTFPTREFDQRCSCGEKVSQCRFWQEIYTRLSLDRFADCEELLSRIPRSKGWLPHDKLFDKILSLFGPRIAILAWRFFESSKDEHIQTYLQFRKLTCEILKTSVFVDGQKNIGKVLALKALLGKKQEMKIIHLIRDPRGFFCSYRKYYNADTRQGAGVWLKSHEHIEKYFSQGQGFSYLPVRYEDLCVSPSATLQRIFSSLGVASQDVCKKPVDLSNIHAVGNKMLRSFDGTIKLDLSWRQSVTKEEQDRILEITRLLFEKYAYSQVNENGIQ